MATTDERIANMDERIALPRKNGELVFEAPWEARAFGLAVALNEQGIYPWRDFSQGLARAIAAAESTTGPTPYYERWLATLEALVIANGLVTPQELEAMIEEQALLDDHDHDHHHHHHH
jgi:nitrile hydratase accessory protein